MTDRIHSYDFRYISKSNSTEIEFILKDVSFRITNMLQYIFTLINSAHLVRHRFN